MRPKFTALPAAPDSGQPDMSKRHHVFAPGQWLLGVLVRLSRRVHHAYSGLAGAGRMTNNFITSGLEQVLLAQRHALPGTTPGLIVHSDRNHTR